MTEDDIRRRLSPLFPDAKLQINGEDCNFELQVVSEAFAGQRPLKRQQTILALFKDDLQSGALHALSVKAYTPAEKSAQGDGLVRLSL